MANVFRIANRLETIDLVSVNLGYQSSVIANTEFFGSVSNVTINTGLGQATINGLAPSYIEAVNTGLSTANVAGIAPTYTETINTGVAGPVINGLAPTYTERINTSLGQATATGFAPSVTVGSAATQVDTFTGQPTVTGILAAIAIGLQTQEGEVSANGFEPQVQLTVVIQTASGQIQVSGASPAVALAIQTYVASLSANGQLAYPVINFRPNGITGSSPILVSVTKNSTLRTGVTFNSLVDGSI